MVLIKNHEVVLKIDSLERNNGKMAILNQFKHILNQFKHILNQFFQMKRIREAIFSGETENILNTIKTMN